jgi:hypothetical protein
MVKTPQAPAMPGMTPLGVTAPAPDYVVTRENYGKTERVIDVQRFAADLSKALGGAPVEKGDESYRDRYARFRLADGTIVDVTRSWHSREFDKVTISIDSASVKIEHNNRPSGDKYKLPKATVSVARPFARILADVKRRVLDPSQAPLAELRAYAAQLAQAKSDLAATAERLRKDHPGISVNIKDGSTHSGTIYRNDESGPYLSTNFYADGRVSIDRLGSLTADQFDRVCRALYND